MMISGFTFVHNALTAGYPIVEAVRAVQPYVDEAVAVDCESTDGTRELLQRLGCRVIDGKWGNEAGKTLRAAHAIYTECHGDSVVHFEADEVFSDSLIRRIVELIEGGATDLAVYRLQLEQGFQRCRWYPEPVHRVWNRLQKTIKVGHTTDRAPQAQIIEPDYGFLWDITNCFKGQWFQRIINQGELWNEEPKCRMVPIHASQPFEIDDWTAQQRLNDPHWTWKVTPFDIPEILRPLVGKTRYEPKL